MPKTKEEGDQMLRIESCTLKGSNELNEDVLVINEQDQVFAVIDGATSVTPYKNKKGKTGGFIAANLLCSYFNQIDSSTSLEKNVLLANEALHHLMKESGVDTLKKSNLWSAAFVVIRLHKTKLEYVQAGDCMLFVTYDDGQIRTITHNSVRKFDAKTIEKSLEGKRIGYQNPKELFHYLLPTLRENRKKANTKKGYSVLNGDPNFADFIEKGTISLAGIERIYMITDGLFYPSSLSTDVINNWEVMIANIDQKGLINYANEIIQLEKDDSQCTKYPRLKISDDKTGIVIELR